MKLPPSPRPPLTNVLLVNGVCTAAAVFYSLVTLPTPQIIEILVVFAPPIATGMWFQKYLRLRRYPMPFDFGYFIATGWPILFPAITKRLGIDKRWRVVMTLYALALAPALGVVVASLCRLILP